MSPRVKKALEIKPGKYYKGTPEYTILDGLSNDDWTDYLDTLARDGRKAVNNNDAKGLSFRVSETRHRKSHREAYQRRYTSKV